MLRTAAVRMRAAAALVTAALATSALAGCGGDNGDSGAAGTSTVAAFYPLWWAADRVGAGHVEVELLTEPGVEPHDLELSPQQVAQVAEADVVVVEGGFQPAVDDAVEQSTAGRIIDVSELVDLIEGTDGTDPHFWLDPVRMTELTDALATTYAAVDPARAGAYRSAARVLGRDLERLDRAYHQRLSGCRTDIVVTSHDAFGYLADRYGLRLLPIAGIDPGTEPSPERLAELADLVREQGVTTIFTETLVSPAVAQTLADEAGVEIATLDPIEGLTDDTADEDYLSLMAANLDALARANGC